VSAPVRVVHYGAHDLDYPRGRRVREPYNSRANDSEVVAAFGHLRALRMNTAIASITSTRITIRIRKAVTWSYFDTRRESYR